MTVITIFIFGCNQPQTKTDNAKQETEAVSDLLPSWNNGALKKSIIDWVKNSTEVVEEEEDDDDINNQ